MNIDHIKSITKLKGGDLLVTFYSGQQATVSRSDELFQVFTVWVMLHPGGDTGKLRAL